MELNKINDEQKNYWKQKLGKHNESYQSIGSESIDHKLLRYHHISKILEDQIDVSILDIGAGFGDYFGFIKENLPLNKIKYTGTEITTEFCKIAKAKYPEIEILNINILESPINNFDFVQMSGLFHQYGSVPKEDWKKFMMDMLLKSFEICKKGISFNVLSNNVDFMKDGNFYVDIPELFNEISKRFSRFVILDQSYPLFETTFHVYKKDFIREKNFEEVFLKYLK